jgi:hypothetical protein
VTGGLLLVAKSRPALQRLSDDLTTHTIRKRWELDQRQGLHARRPSRPLLLQAALGRVGQGLLPGAAGTWRW